MIITIDGPAGAGKGTVCQYLALKYNLHKLDTGLLYRALAAMVLKENIDEEDTISIIRLAQKVTLEHTYQDGLKTEQIASMASKVAIIPEVRTYLTKIQRDFAYSNHEAYEGVILDGRDIGTVVCPEAPCKIYLTATEKVRANRRHKEEQKNTPTIPQNAVENMIQERDLRDASRTTAPLNAAPDAFIIDTSHLTIDEVCQKAAYYIENFCFKGLCNNKSNDYSRNF